MTEQRGEERRGESEQVKDAYKREGGGGAQGDKGKMSGNRQLMKKKKHKVMRGRRGGTMKGEEDHGAGVEGEKRTGREGLEGWRGGGVEGHSSYFDIKQHGGEFNVPFTAPFACL